MRYFILSYYQSSFISFHVWLNDKLWDILFYLIINRIWDKICYLPFYLIYFYIQSTKYWHCATAHKSTSVYFLLILFRTEKKERVSYTSYIIIIIMTKFIFIYGFSSNSSFSRGKNIRLTNSLYRQISLHVKV